MIKRICKTENLTGKERLAASVLTNDYNILLSKGTWLQRDYIEKLKELNIKRSIYLG